ncbi:MAG: glycosyltransferase [Clostridia bacterium]|nr:glycosyltransferase [Clostridia bacterium]
MKKTLIFILHTLNVGGGERHSITVANYLAQNGYDVTVILIDDPVVRFKADDRIKIIYLKNKFDDISCFDLTKNVSPCEIIESKTDDYSVDLIDRIKLNVFRHINIKRYQSKDSELYFRKNYINKLREYLSSRPDAFVISFMTVCNIVTAAALEGLPNKGMFSEFTSPATEFPKEHYMNDIKRRYYQNDIGGIFQTEEERDFYTYLKDKRSYVIPNPVLGDYPERFVGERKKIIVNFCRLNKAKNLFLLADAFALFSAEYPDYELHIYGEGALKEEIESYIDDLGLKDKIRLLPFDTKLHGKIKDHAMFVSSSDYEGISNSMLEAMAIGLPVICTDCPAGGARMVIEDHINGILVPVRDKVAMYKAMKELIDDPALAEKLSVNAVSVKEKYSVENIGKMWADALDREMSEKQ